MQFLNDEQSELLKHYIIVPFVLRVFQRDLKIIMQSPLKTKEPYLETINLIIDRIMNDIAKIKKRLRSAKISIYHQEQDGYSVHYKFKYAGYDHHESMTWYVLRYEMQKFMKQYLLNE